MSRDGRNGESLECAACSAELVLEQRARITRSPDEKADLRKEILLIAASALIGGASFLGLPSTLRLILLGAAYLLAGWKVLYGAARAILQGRVFSELFLMSIATLGAIAIGYNEEALAVMVFYRIGELFQERATNRSRASVRALLDLRPDRVRIKSGSAWVEIASEEARVGDRFLVRPGERIALDARVIEGEAFLDCSVLTGESKPRAVLPGAEAAAGSISLDGSLVLEALRPARESSAARIAGLVEEASSKKAHTERWISRFAGVYTPAVVGLAAATAFLPPLLIPGQVFSVWAYRALVMLVISCPCALVLSVPLAFFCGMGGCARRGILVKGAETLEALAGVKTFVFDKTGTLTEGSFRVVEIRPAAGRSADELLSLAAAAEALSRHPMAASIRSAAAARGLSLGVEDEVSEIREYPGAGVVARVGSSRIVAGNDRLLHREGVQHATCEPDGTAVNIAVNSLFAGTILLGDEIKSDAHAAITGLRKLGVDRIVLLTGDAACSAEPVAEELGISEVHADLLPEDKLERLTGLAARHSAGVRQVAFVGDGINDAPVIAAADVGIAMGSGSDAAIESADIVLMTDEPARVTEALARARLTRRIVAQDIAFALGAKLLLLSLGALGLAGMWAAVVGDVGVALAAVANSLRALGRVEPSPARLRRPEGVPGVRLPDPRG